MRYSFYTISEKAWLAMFEAIRSAKRFIYLESFILADDEITHHFFEALKSKAAEGVQVKIVLDRVGHLWLGGIDLNDFRKAGIEVLFFNRWIYRSHRKVLVVDGEIGFLGGVNIKGEYAKWFDLHLKISGKHMLRALTSSFARVYMIAGGKDASVLDLVKVKKLIKTRSAIYRAKTWLVEHAPFKGKSVLRDYYRKKCAQAKKDIKIVTPYFIPHHWLIRALERAAARGVKIEVIVPKNTDVFLADVAHMVFAENLKGFIDFFFIPEMNHAKVLLVDGREGLIGSNNIDAQSFDFNLEVSIGFDRKDMAGDLKKIIERWRSQAIPFSETGFQKKWYHKLIAFVISLIQPIL